MTTWFDEVDLDPETSWRRMGTRSLGDRPWLVVDEKTPAELALRRNLFDQRREAVFAPAPIDVGLEVGRLVDDALGSARPSGGADPLASAGLAVQEDLCLLRHRADAWHLDAAFVCFPSRWRLADKLGRPLVEVHAPTEGYAERLAPRVDRLLDRLTERPVFRRNWFVHPDAALHQPDASSVDPVIPASDVSTALHLRSERQTLRRLPSGWILFTIRVQQATLGAFCDEPSRRERFLRYVRDAPPDDLDHRGVSEAQRCELRAALGDPE